MNLDKEDDDEHKYGDVDQHQHQDGDVEEEKHLIPLCTYKAWLATYLWMEIWIFWEKLCKNKQRCGQEQPSSPANNRIGVPVMVQLELSITYIGASYTSQIEIDTSLTNVWSFGLHIFFFRRGWEE